VIKCSSHSVALFSFDIFIIGEKRKIVKTEGENRRRFFGNGVLYENSSHVSKAVWDSGNPAPVGIFGE
jgi:hypothetical protein